MVPVPIRSRYTVFYLIMLILASIGAFFTLFGFINDAFSIILYLYSSGEPLLAILRAINIVVGIASIVALILLYMKKKSGFIMKIVLIFLSLIISTSSTIITLSNPMYSDATQYGIESIKDSDRDQISTIIAGAFNQENIKGLVVVTSIIGFFISTGYALLWFFAWKSQVEDDARFADLPN